MQFILHMAMTPRGHVVLDPGHPGRDGRRFVWQIGCIIRLLNERLAHRIPRAWCNAAIGSYLSGSSPRSLGVGAMVLIPLRLEFCRRATALSETLSPPRQNLLGFHDFTDRSRRKPPKPWR